MAEPVAARYIRDNFAGDDRLAVVLLDKRAGGVIQRIATAEKMAAPDFQTWLTQKNQERFEVYLSMNTLRPGATGRTKNDIDQIRHVFLDFDHDAAAALERLLARRDLPAPNYLVSTSPGKWHVVWKVHGFDKVHAEALQKGLAREMGADPAATDCSRVLRLPGFHNHKYTQPPLVGLEERSREVYSPSHFPKSFAVERPWERPGAIDTTVRREGTVGMSQSERDWAYAKRALARGEPESLVVAAIAQYRRSDKQDPQYYAELTVRKAAESLHREVSVARPAGHQPTR